MFRRKKEQEAPRTAPVTPMTPERQRQEDNFRALMSEINPAALDDSPPPPPESRGDAIGRGIAGFLGFVPQGGTRGDAADGFANMGRAFFGAPSVQQVENDYNQSINPERLRRAVESGDREAIARIDPAVARQVQQIERTDADAEIAAEDRSRRILTEDEERARLLAVREAVEAGDVERVKRLDPELYSSLFEQDEAEEKSRRARGVAATRAAERMGKENFPMVLDAMVADGTINLTPEEIAFGKANGAEALRELLGQEIAERDPLTDAYRRAQIASLNRRGTGAGDEVDTSPGFFRNQMSDNLAEMRSLVQAGEAVGAFPSVARGRMDAIGARAANLADDATGGLLLAGTERQQYREQLESAAWATANTVRGLLEENGVKVGATQLNTEKEAERFMKVIANPNATTQTINASLDRMERAFLQDMQMYGLTEGGARQTAPAPSRPVAGGTITEGADGVRDWTPGGR